MKTTNCCLQKLLDQFRGHSNSESTSSPKCPAQEERRHWEGERAIRGWTTKLPVTCPSPFPLHSSPCHNNCMLGNIYNLAEKQHDVIRQKQMQTYDRESFSQFQFSLFAKQILNILRLKRLPPPFLPLAPLSLTHTAKSPLHCLFFPTLGPQLEHYKLQLSLFYLKSVSEFHGLSNKDHLSMSLKAP